MKEFKELEKYKVNKEQKCWYYSTVIAYVLIASYWIYGLIMERQLSTNILSGILALMSLPVLFDIGLKK
ncbi:MAG: hypothetical protein ACK5LC_07580 [Coprobacillaceae bacterium]